MFQRTPNRRMHVQDAIEAADREDFRDNGLQCRKREFRLVLTHLLRRDHHDAQPDAADVLNAGEIQYQRNLLVAALLQKRRQRFLELPGAGMIDATDGRGDDDVSKSAA